jgi:peptidoglycan/xylan/chitin deacetylase (PgdA/CDA1 family)
MARSPMPGRSRTPRPVSVAGDRNRRMNNADRYRFADFTASNYRRLLRIAKRCYVLRRYSDFKPGERFLLWRHDVDFSMHRAARLAAIEAEEGVHATYFLLLHSELYNLLERENADLVRQIAVMGHDLALHFDPHFHNVDGAKGLERWLAWERNLLQDLFGREIRSFSLHITSPLTDTFRAPSYAGMVNVYSEYFRTQVDYCSDSNGYWRFRRLEDVLGEAGERPLQVLTHPELWQDAVMSPRERVERCIAGRAEKSRAWYDGILRENGRENIDW